MMLKGQASEVLNYIHSLNPEDGKSLKMKLLKNLSAIEERKQNYQSQRSESSGSDKNGPNQKFKLDVRFKEI